VSDGTPTISIVAPVCNEAEGIAAFHARLRPVAAGLGDVEIVYVDDGSTDASWKELLAIGADDPTVRLIRLSRNFGHQMALTAGLEAARGRAVVTIDSDLQDPPELIPELVSRWHDGFEVVHAVRAERAGERQWRLLAIRAYYGLLGRIAGTDIPAQSGDFRLFSRRALDALDSMPERARYIRGMASWIGFHQTTVSYARDPRAAGGTKYPLRKLVHLGADGILSFSTVPLKLVSILGGILVVFCSAVLAWSLYSRLFTSHYPAGWTSVIAVVLLLGGVQLLSLGVIGQYVARIFDEAKGRPLYFVAETVESQNAIGSAVGADRSSVA
jgi:polyisoprenyl-phosphate glycosyltransferase